MRDLWCWIKSSHWVVKAFLVSSIAIILGNIVLIVVLNAFYMHDVENPGANAKPLTEGEYREAFLKNFDQCSITSDRILSLMEDRQPDNSRWQPRVELQVTYLKVLINQARQLVPPEEHEVAHDSYMRAISEFSWAADNILKALATQDMNLYNKCNKRLQKGQYFMGEAADRLMLGL